MHRISLLTALLVPFTACSARLTVFVLVGATFFGSGAGNVVFGALFVGAVNAANDCFQRLALLGLPSNKLGPLQFTHDH